ncbi:hypothetical protein H2200_009344 [Cladophialophora chaetospira]|uniref:NADP-dependent oxidoreductase domain-containing protein n=1 Tax=Cladophialophora chaetospira TaxID=386627 RepID=A0AA39CFA1_9EURO|nr:hypothetical protein H2200_009344 [Cladophialophora chaetospira]
MANNHKAMIIYGAESLSHVDEQEAASILNVAKKGGITAIDTAALYKGSERLLGQLDVALDFTIHTKTPGVIPGCMSQESIINGMEQSLHDLHLDKVEIYYLHTADSATPLEETLSAIQQLYKHGKFDKLGISNLSTEQVQDLYDLAKEKSMILPSVYQGNYNPVARHAEKNLFPLLRKLGIKFYAYSPLAGGFLAKSARDLRGDNMHGRWSRDDPVGQIYHKLYNRPSLVAALEQWERLAHENGMKMAEMAYRWILYDSALKPELGDKIIIGSRRASQLEETLEIAHKGPLKKFVLHQIDLIWQSVENEAPIDNMQD